MNTLNKITRRISGLMAVLMLTMSFSGHAQARILFQDDTFHDVESEGMIINFDDGGDEDVTLQFGNDSTDASIRFDDGDTSLHFENTEVDFSTVNNFRIREDADPATNAACDHLGELIYDTGSSELQICTVVGAAGAATWSAVDSPAGAVDFESVYTTDGDDTLTTSNGNFSIAAGTGDVNVDADSISLDGTNASNLSVATDAAAEDLTIEVTGATNSSLVLQSTGTGTDAIDINSTAGDIDIDASGDNAITIDATESSNLTVTSDAAGEDLTIAQAGGTDSSLVLNTSGTGTDALDINATGTGGGIDVDTTDGAITINAAGGTNGDVTIGSADDTAITSGGLVDIDATEALSINSSGGVINIGDDAVAQNINVGTGAAARTLNIGNATGATAVNIDAGTGGWSIDGAGASNITTTGAASDITFASGRDIIFDDDNLTGTVVLSVADSDWDADFTGDGIIDNINDVATALGADGLTSLAFNFTEANVLADNDAVYAALEKLDLRWGDLASTANGEGASLVGIEDSGGNFTATNVEGALSELAADIGNTYDQMVFEPEYPNYVVFQDGSANRGKLEALYDSTNREHYYTWTTRQAADQDVDIRFRYELPTDWNATGNLVIRFRTGLTTAANNTLAVTVRNDTDDTTCHADAATAGTVADTWEDLTITAGEINTGCTAGAALAAGDTVEIQLKLLADNTASAKTDVGTIDWDYTK